MGIYTEYTLTRKQKVIVVYHCSKCGEINITLQDLISQEIYNDKGTWTKKGVAKRENSAREKLQKDSEKLLEKAKGKAEISDYKNFDLKGVCSKCGNTEPWSKIVPKLLDIVCLFCGIVSFVTGISLLGGASKESLVVFFVSLLPWLVRFIRITSREDKIVKLEEKSLPKVFTDPLELKKYLEKNDSAFMMENDGSKEETHEDREPVKEELDEIPKEEPIMESFSDEKIGKNYKISPNAKMKAIGKVSHYSFNGMAKLVYVDNCLHIYRKSDEQEVMTVDFKKLSKVEICKTLSGKPLFRFVTTSDESIEIALEKNDTMAEEFSKIFESEK